MRSLPHFRSAPNDRDPMRKPRIKPPECPRCHVATTQLHEIPASDLRPGRAYFECPSCFVITQAPLSYEIKHTSRQ